MKSFFGFLLALLVSGTLAAQAQTAPAAHAPKADHAPMAADHAPKEPKMKMTKAKPTSTMMPGAGPMKKDGTPDMRYKANKARKM